MALEVLKVTPSVSIKKTRMARLVLSSGLHRDAYTMYRLQSGIPLSRNISQEVATNERYHRDLLQHFDLMDLAALGNRRQHPEELLPLLVRHNRRHDIRFYVHPHKVLFQACEDRLDRVRLAQAQLSPRYPQGLDIPSLI